MDAMNIDEALLSLESGKRNFAQSYDLIVNLKNIDLKKPENKFSKDVLLPHGRGSEIEVCVISEKTGFGKREIEELERDKKKMRALMQRYDFFLCEAALMPLVGRVLGKYLGPKGKMPKLLPPGKDPASTIEEVKRSVRVRIRDSPNIQVLVGNEKMQRGQLKENVEKVMEEIKKSLPGKVQIKNAYLKKTMSGPVRIKV